MFYVRIQFIKEAVKKVNEKYNLNQHGIGISVYYIFNKSRILDFLENIYRHQFMQIYAISHKVYGKIHVVLQQD